MGVNLIDPLTGDPTPVDGMRTIEDCKQLILEFCYPVGSFYISTKNVSPQTFLGGTWESRSGYMLRAATSDVTFDKANDTNDGGADSVTVSSVASHNHTQDSHNHTQNAHNHAYSSTGATLGANSNVGTEHGGVANSNYGPGSGGSYTMWSFGTAVENKTATNQAKTATNQANGADYTVPTLPKYKNVYMWERTA